MTDNNPLYAATIGHEELYLSTKREIATEVKGKVEDALEKISDRIKDPFYKKALKQLGQQGAQSSLSIIIDLKEDAAVTELADQLRKEAEAKSPPATDAQQ